MKTALVSVGAVAGLLALDLLLNLPGVRAGTVAGSLLLPSIDLLVIGAILLGGAQSGAGGRRALRLVAVLALLVIAGYEAVSRFGIAAAIGLFGTGAAARVASGAVSLLALAAAGLASWLAAGLVLLGLRTLLARSVFVAAVSAAAILQVLTGGKVLAPSLVPRMARDIAAAFTG